MSEKEYKKIHFHVFNPHNALFKDFRNDKAKSFLTLCNNSENCELFTRGECVMRSTSSGRCIYGKNTSQTGFTRRARGFYSWIKKQEDANKDVGKLSAPQDVIATIGDYVYLPYSHINLNNTDVEFISPSGFMTSGTPFIKKEDFTVEAIIKLINFRPHAMMGGEIKCYQKEEVPKFLKHLSERFPDLFANVLKESDYAKEKYYEYSNIGRQAKLSSINPNKGKLVDIHGAEWIWDGEWLTSTNSKASFTLVHFSEIKIKPEPGEIIKITSEDQINSETVFID